MGNCIHLFIIILSLSITQSLFSTNYSAIEKPLSIKGDWAYPPYEFINDSGEPDGFNVEIMHALFKELNYPYEIKLENWVDVQQGYINGEVDIVTGMIYTDTRVLKYKLGEAFCYVNYTFVCRKNNIINSLQSAVGKKCFVQSGEITAEILTRNGVDAGDIIPSHDNIDILKRLANGEGDLAFCSSDIAKHMILKYGLTNLEIVDVGILPLEYCFVTKDYEMLAKLGGAFYAIKKNGKYDMIYNKWFGKNKSTNISHKIYIVVSILMSALIFFFFFVYLLNKKVHRANKQISLQNKQLEYLLHINSLDLKRYHTIFDSTLAGIEVYDNNGILVNINDSYCSIFGIAEKELILNSGLSFRENPILSELISSNPNAVFRDIIRFDLRKTKRSRYFKHSTKDEVLFVDTRISPIINKNGDWENIICTYIDQTAIYNHNQILNIEQEKLTKALTLLNIEKEKAQRADKLKSAFLANMSHEIRTPLNAIAGFAHIIPYSETPEKTEEYLNIIDLNKEMLLQIIDNILDLSKIESGLMDFSYENFDLSACFLSLYNSYKERINNENIEFVLNCRYSRCIICSDWKRLKQIMMNFISNSIKYTTEGVIEIGFNIVDNGIKLYIKDTGKGISAKNHYRVFSRFQKFDDFAQGPGLGLAICKSLAELAGGSIDFYSEDGVGSEFWVWLPVTPSEVEIPSSPIIL